MKATNQTSIIHQIGVIEHLNGIKTAQQVSSLMNPIRFVCGGWRQCVDCSVFYVEDDPLIAQSALNAIYRVYATSSDTCAPWEISAMEGWIKNELTEEFNQIGIKVSLPPLKERSLPIVQVSPEIWPQLQKHSISMPEEGAHPKTSPEFLDTSPAYIERT